MEKIIARNEIGRETTITLPPARESRDGSAFVITARESVIVQANNGHNYAIPYGTSLRFPVTGFWERIRAWWYQTS